MLKSAAALRLKIVPIGNSRGVRLPKAILSKYAFKDSVVLEAREEGILLRGTNDRRLSWNETYREMAAEREDWSDFESMVADGLDE